MARQGSVEETRSTELGKRPTVVVGSGENVSGVGLSSSAKLCKEVWTLWLSGESHWIVVVAVVVVDVLGYNGRSRDNVHHVWHHIRASMHA